MSWRFPAPRVGRLPLQASRAKPTTGDRQPGPAKTQRHVASSQCANADPSGAIRSGAGPGGRAVVGLGQLKASTSPQGAADDRCSIAGGQWGCSRNLGALRSSGRPSGWWWHTRRAHRKKRRTPRPYGACPSRYRHTGNPGDRHLHHCQRTDHNRPRQSFRPAPQSGIPAGLRKDPRRPHHPIPGCRSHGRR